MGSVVVEENQNRSDFTMRCKATTAVIHNDSISVDIVTGETNKTAESCNHFSIRGYVAEARMWDRKKCFPFASDDDYNDSMEKSYELPPLDVPKFRWWQCNGCLHGSGSERTTPNLFKQPNGCNNGGKCINTYSQKLAEAACPVLLPKDDGQTSKLNIREEENHEVLSGLENVPPTSDVIEVDVVVRDRHTDNSAVSSKLKCNANCDNGHLLETHLFGRKDPDDCQQRDLPAVELAAVVGDAGHATEGRLIRLPDLNECDGITPEHEEIIVVNNPCDDEEDDFNGARCWKIRKTRLLSELLGLKEYGNAEHIGKDVASHVDFPDRSTPKDLLSVVEGEALITENGSHRLTHWKKRKILNDEGFRPLAIIDSSNGNKKIVSVSGTEDNSYAEIVSRAMPKGSCCKHTLDRNRGVEKKSSKCKEDECGDSLASRQKATLKGNKEKAGAASVNESIDPFDGSHLMKQQTDRSTFVSSLKKKQVPHNLKEQTPSIPLKNFKLGDCSTARKDAEIQPFGNASAGRLTHNPSLFAGTDSTHLSPIQDRFCLRSVEQEPILVDVCVVTKGVENKNSGDSSTPFTAAVAGKERSICQKSNSKGKQKLIPEVIGGSLPLVEHSVVQVSMGMHKKGATTEVHGHMRDIDINTIPVDDKVLEQRASDDIPMDIVELMAKHQHERRGDGAKDKHLTFGAISYGKNAWPIGSSSNNSYGTGPPVMSNLWQENIFGTQRPQSGNTRNGLISGFDDAMSFKQNLLVGNFSEIDRAHFNIGHPREAYSSGRFGGAAQYTERVSRDPRFYSLGLASHNWSGNISSQRYPHGFLHGLESLSGSPASSQKNLAARVGPSVNPNRPSLGLGNSGILLHGSNKQKIDQGCGFFNLNGPRIEKQDTNLSKSWNTKLTEYSSAMQLLNLMHTGGKPELLKSPPLRPDQQHDQFASGHHFVAYKNGGNSRHPSLDNDGRTTLPEKPHPCYSSIPTVFASAFPNEASAGSSFGVTDRFYFTSQDPRYDENYPLSIQGGDLSKAQISYASSRRQLSVSAVEKGKDMPSPSRSAVPPLHKPVELTHQNQLATRRDQRTDSDLPTAWTEVCFLSRNPAEFNDLNMARKYMIGPEDLRPAKGIRGKSAQSRKSAKKVGEGTKVQRQQRS
ncbi:hypothetical protein Nepgr_012648 [Nepenthes gracilis]|uniref:Protein EMBRYONIC FLOWER 1-like n=1 Tax=Nepenthes gracilis TaxID=150966 RepID=A0AAD3SGG5_NEPGR|nr:hypothetical protein Nepgr_012648 [Nepenthes gracilis]